MSQIRYSTGTVKPQEQAGEAGICVRAFKQSYGSMHAILYTGTVDPDRTLHFDDPDPIILFYLPLKSYFFSNQI